jgi:hypothetical protein
MISFLSDEMTPTPSRDGADAEWRTLIGEGDE